jgi:hypothetical protein
MWCFRLQLAIYYYLIVRQFCDHVWNIIITGTLEFCRFVVG